MKTNNKDLITISRVVAPIIPSIKEYKKITGEHPPYSKGYWYELSKGHKHCNRVNNGKRLSEEEIETIRTYWYQNSRVAPNEMFVVKKKTQNSETVYSTLYYRQNTIKEIFRQFQQEYPDIKICRNTFYKHKPKNIKKPKSIQDYCPICKDIRKLEAQGLFDDNNPQYDDLRHAKIFHKNMVMNRYKEFEKLLNDFNDDEAIIVIDFKANITLGKGPIEDARIFFSAPQRTLFGAAVYLKKNGVVYKVNISVISSILNHDAKMVRNILMEKIFTLKMFDDFKINKFNIWMDNAPNHFRVTENFATMFQLQQEFDKQVEMNFFAEYHGKSECDRHFGFISRMYKEHVKYMKNNDINTTDDFIKMYKDAVIGSGGNVMPSVGSHSDEFHSIDKEKLNVIIMKYENSEISEEIINQHAENFNPDKRNKSSIRIPLQYTKSYIDIPDKDFSMRNFYKFKFGKTQSGKNIIIGNLGNSSANQYYEEKKFEFSIKEEEVPDYSLKYCSKTAKVDLTKSLQTSLCKYKYHFAGMPTPNKETRFRSRLNQ